MIQIEDLKEILGVLLSPDALCTFYQNFHAKSRQHPKLTSFVLPGSVPAGSGGGHVLLPADANPSSSHRQRPAPSRFRHGLP